ncbi:MAG: hypothetical protein WCG15_02385 [Actinomycetes bacterium]|jgi:hypothetical protein
MSTVKISELVNLPSISANTSNTIFLGVDLPTRVTGRFTATTLAQQLFANNYLVVGQNYQTIFPNTVGQISGSDPTFLQFNMQNFNSTGSGDYVVTADKGTNSNSYIDMGINNSQYSDPNFSSMNPYDGYLYVHGPSDTSYQGNLILGAFSSNANIYFVAGGTQKSNIAVTISNTALVLDPGTRLVFGDDTIQTTASIGSNYSQAAYALANTNSNTITYINGVNAYQNTYSNAAFDKANTSVQNTAIININSLTLTGNLIANGIGQTASIDNVTSNNATFNKNITVLGTITANTLLGNVFFSNVITGTSISNSIQWFAQYNSPSQQDGQVWYSANTISLIQDTDIVGDRPAISKVLFERVYNNTGSAIPNNSWVRLAGGVTSNSVPYVQLADATSAANSTVEGFIKVGIAAGAYGFVYTRGIVSEINASTFGTNGQQLFLSTTPGQATNVAPTGANSVVQVAKILSNGVANGKLQVVIANQQAYGKPNGAILFANNNLIQASNTAIINESAGTIYLPNGIIYNQRSYPGAQTAVTLNFATDTWVRANISANFAVTLGNFVAGSDIVLFITNTATGGGSAKTITHGVSALNSTVGATTFTLSGGTTARIKYYSFDGDLANTYASISYS